MSKVIIRASLVAAFICILLFVAGCHYLKPMAFKPDAVSNVVAKPDASNKVVLTWALPKDSPEGGKAKGYKITRSYDGTNFFEVGTAKPNASTYTDNPPEGWSIVGYSVYGFNDTGNANPAGSNWAFARPPSGWSTINTLDSQQLEDISRGNIAMAVDSSNALHAVYLGLDKGLNAILYRKKAGNSTAFGPAIRISTAGTSSSHVTIAVDQKDNPHISYDTEYISSSDGGVTWPSKTTTFVTTTGIPGNNNVSAMAIDSNSKTHIICGYNLQYYTNASGTWVNSTIEKKPGGVSVFQSTSSIAIDSNNKVHVVYAYTQNGPTTVKYATNASGTWVSEKVIDFKTTGIGFPYPTIALDQSGKPHIAYYSGSLDYTNKVSGSWTSPTVLDNTSYGQYGMVGLFPSISIDKSNKVHIAYRELFGPSLKYATNSSGSWVKSALMSCSVSAPSSWLGGGGPCPIKIDNNGKIHIAFVDAASKVSVAYKYITK
jgi:hypothetical protein